MSVKLGERLQAVEEELRRWREEGETAVFVEESTLQVVRDLVRSSQPKREPAAPSAAKPAKPRPPSRVRKAAARPSLPEPPVLAIPDGDKTMRLEWLRDRVLNCSTCLANLNPKGKVVFGGGDSEADLFFCGEAPGADEEIAGEPFVGAAGQFLDKIIKGMGLAREQVYVANVMKWRPQHENPYGNRPPTQDEMNFCLPYLKAQIEIIQPKVIVALGATAVSGLLGPDPQRRMGKVRGQWFEFEEVPLMITFHPSYLLRNESKRTKRQVWEDMLQVMEQVDLPISERQRDFYT
jgi:DNA polymerase